MSKNNQHVLEYDFNFEFPTITHGKGIYLYDTDGKEYIDGCGGMISNSLGHGREDMAKVVAEQTEAVAFVNRHVATTDSIEKAADKLHEVTGMDRFFTVCGGTEANEICTKIARLHWYHKGQPNKNKIIGRWNSYHGYSIDTLSYGGHNGRRKEFMTYLRDDIHTVPPYCYRCWFGKECGSCDLECANSLEEEILKYGPENIAGFIFEVVSGTAMNASVAPPEYYKRIREICDKYDVLMIVDEVMTGAGRTGSMLAIDQYGIKPDIVTMAKSIGGGYFPVGIACCTEEVIEPIREYGLFSPVHTWASNPIASAVALKTIEIFEDENLIENVRIQGAYMKEQLEAMKERHPSIGNVSGKGLMLGVEFVKDKATKEPFDPNLKIADRLMLAAMDMGLFVMNTAGFAEEGAGDGIMFGPCFEITKEEVDKMLEIFEKAIDKIESEEGM